jgi:hypothetical protein
MIIVTLGILLTVLGGALNISMSNFTRFEGINTYTFYQNIFNGKFEGKWHGSGDV